MVLMRKKTYIGDSVYAEWNGAELILTTENGYPDDPRNRIVLGPSEYECLTIFVEHLKLAALRQAKEDQSGEDKPNDDQH